MNRVRILVLCTAGSRITRNRLCQSTGLSLHQNGVKFWLAVGRGIFISKGQNGSGHFYTAEAYRRAGQTSNPASIRCTQTGFRNENQ